MTNRFQNYVQNLTDKEIQMRNFLARQEFPMLKTIEEQDNTIEFLNAINSEYKRRLTNKKQ